MWAKCPNLPIGWAIEFIPLCIHSRVILAFLQLFAPLRLKAIANILPPPSLLVESPILLHPKAAQDSLHLNGQSGLKLVLTQKEAYFNEARLVLIGTLPNRALPCTVGWLEPPREQQVGTRFITPGKAIGAPLSGILPLNKRLVTVGFFTAFGRNEQSIVVERLVLPLTANGWFVTIIAIIGPLAPVKVVTNLDRVFRRPKLVR